MRSKLGLCLVLAGVLYFNPARAQGAAGESVIKPEKTESRFPVRPYGFIGNWKLDLGGGNAQEGKDTWSAGYVWFDSNIDFKLAEPLKVHIEPYARLYSGRAQERYDDDNLDSRIGVHDAHASFTPIEFLELKGGLHNQSIVDNTMLVSRWRAFAGFQEILKAKAGQFEGRLVLQQVIPNSHSLNTEREKQETLPWFRTEHIEVVGKHWNLIEWKAKAGLYEWNAIPSKVAAESVNQGNVGDNSTKANASFDYSHQGWFGGAELCLCTGGVLSVVAEFDRIHNIRAPGDAADAQSVGVGPRFTLKDYELNFRFRNYFIESDATIAAYNSSRLGGTNRIGETAEVALRFKKYGFSLYGEMYRVKPLNDNPRGTQQRDMEQYYFGLETDYANF